MVERTLIDRRYVDVRVDLSEWLVGVELGWTSGSGFSFTFQVGPLYVALQSKPEEGR